MGGLCQKVRYHFLALRPWSIALKTLIVVDPQQAYFLPDCLPVVDGEQSLANIRAIVQAFSGPKILVKHVAADTPFATDHPGHDGPVSGNPKY